MKLNRISLIALALAAPLAFAQTSAQVQSQPQTDNTTTPPPAVIVLPERVIETKVDLSTGGPQSGQSAADARTEWGAVMATTMLAMAPPVAVVMLMQRWFVKGLVDTEK